MNSELVISLPLTKRLKTDHFFKNMLFQSNLKFEKLEEGINIANCLDENESLFSKAEDSDDSDIIESALRDSQYFKNMRINEGQKEIEDYKLLYRNMVKHVTLHNEKHTKQNRKVLTLFPIIKITRDPSPIKCIRFMDYVFPLDSSIFKEYDLEPKQHKTFVDVSDYKKVNRAFYDKHKEVFITELSEKTVFEGLFSIFERQMDYYVEWQNSLNSNKAHKFAMTLNAIKNKAQLGYKQEIECSNTLKNITDVRTFIKEIDKETLTFIKTQPYNSRQHKIEFNATSDETGLVQEEYNWPYQNQLGYQKEDTEEVLHILLKSGITKHICTRETYQIINSIFTSNRHTKIDKKLQRASHEGTLLLIDRYNNEKYEYKMMILEESYVEKGFLYKRSYQIPVEMKPIISQAKYRE